MTLNIFDFDPTCIDKDMQWGRREQEDVDVIQENG